MRAADMPRRPGDERPIILPPLGRVAGRTGSADAFSGVAPCGGSPPAGGERGRRQSLPSVPPGRPSRAQTTRGRAVGRGDAVAPRRGPCCRQGEGCAVTQRGSDWRRRVAPLLAAALLSACASTMVTLQPPASGSLCAPAASALVLWSTRWRAEQKDVAAREAVAGAALADFFAASGCHAHSVLRRVEALPPEAPPAPPPSGSHQRTIGIEVRELGPVLRLGSSAALVEGGTEVALLIRVYPGSDGSPAVDRSVHWRHGGPGVVRGVATLRADMQSALRAGFGWPATR